MLHVILITQIAHRIIHHYSYHKQLKICYITGGSDPIRNLSSVRMTITCWISGRMLSWGGWPKVYNLWSNLWPGPFPLTNLMKSVSAEVTLGISHIYSGHYREAFRCAAKQHAVNALGQFFTNISWNLWLFQLSTLEIWR